MFLNGCNLCRDEKLRFLRPRFTLSGLAFGLLTCPFLKHVPSCVAQVFQQFADSRCAPGFADMFAELLGQFDIIPGGAPIPAYYQRASPYAVPPIIYSGCLTEK